ncbi:MAG TPA: S8 family serine peptidase [Nocardioidaceae bacterium]|nr:S8 family serine peptidase [Nocardioidaceae bacterium]
MPQVLEYYSGNRKQHVTVQGLFAARQSPSSRGADAAPMRFPVRPQGDGDQVLRLLAAQPRTVLSRFSVVSESTTLVAPVSRPGETTVIPTDTVTVLGARTAETTWARRKYGVTIAQEGSDGKVLLAVPADVGDPAALTAEVARALYERGTVTGAHPNFLRLVQRPGPATAGASAQWGLDNDGTPGVVGADVAAHAAWTLSAGDPDVCVAVLDEGVDTRHPYLRAAVRAERDFVDGNPTAAPDGDDAHGTACAGIVAARGPKVRGLAHGAGLVAVRIAKSDGGQGWIFDDFTTADAIDWSWRQGKADVLSNSWGGGPPVDVITAAFRRARNRGRGGKGAVVVIASGNEQGVVSYPGNLPEVLTVGASNQWDQRKTRTSQDGETWWGSNIGPGLDLMAPGVGILTTDISGRRGYGRALTTPTFNGTSAATPFAAAAAALVLSVRPDLGEADVRRLLVAHTDHIGRGRPGWSRFVGHGRLNAFAAVRAARRR